MLRSSRLVNYLTVTAIVQHRSRQLTLRPASYLRLAKTETRRIYRVQPKAGSASTFNIVYNIVIQIEKLLSVFGLVVERAVMPLVPPDNVRGMTALDRTAFRRVVHVPSLTVPVEHVGRLQKVVKKSLFKMQGVKALAELAEGDANRDKYRLFLFDPEKHPDVSSFDAEEREVFQQCGVILTSWRVLEIELNFINWHYDEILKAVLPADSEGVGGFSVIGHVLHLNLREELQPYKHIIGEVLLEKVAAVETVVNKLNIIDSTYRNFAMEVLAGDENFVTVAKENGCSFKMDFSKVYWNPRLGTEHQKLIAPLKRGDIVYDVMAGIGPFAVPAAKKGCIVLANDLNPESFKWLQHNMQMNKVKSNPQTYNLDGREFIKTVLKAHLLSEWNKTDGEGDIHVVMNLPALAIEFLDVFPGLLADSVSKELAEIRLPLVHCYTFSKAEDPKEDVRQRIRTALGAELPEDHEIRFVRNVAPNKDMLCAEFKLEKDLLLKHCQGEDTKLENVVPKEADEDLEPPQKKNRTEEPSLTS